MMKCFIDDRKAVTQVLEVVLFIILNLIFIASLIVFVNRAGSSSAVLEQAYTKELAIAIDMAKPGTIISVNIEELAKKTGNSEKSNLINFRNSRISVGKYKYSVFTGYDIEVCAVKDSGINQARVYVHKNKEEKRLC